MKTLLIPVVFSLFWDVKKVKKQKDEEKWKNEKYLVQNPVRLGQSRLDNKLLTLNRVGKVENWNWKTFAVQTILQKQANMVKVAEGSRSDSYEMPGIVVKS